MSNDVEICDGFTVSQIHRVARNAAGGSRLNSPGVLCQFRQLLDQFWRLVASGPFELRRTHIGWITIALFGVLFDRRQGMQHDESIPCHRGSPLTKGGMQSLPTRPAYPACHGLSAIGVYPPLHEVARWVSANNFGFPRLESSSPRRSEASRARSIRPGRSPVAPT
jgi:hypothetical protein